MISKPHSRIAYIDYTKAIGILFIVFAHCSQYFPTMSTATALVCSFHVPVFFMASGCLESYKEDLPIRVIIEKSFRSLIIPYIFFSLINSIIKFGALLVLNQLTKEAIVSELEALFITGNGTVWFLLTLFVVKICFSALKSICNNRILFTVSVLTLVIPFLIPYHNNTLLLIGRCVFGFGFFSLGYILSNVFKYKAKYFIISISLVTLCLGILGFIFGKPEISFFEGKYNNPISSLICSISFSLFIICFCNIIDVDSNGSCKICQVMEYLGKNSLIIMLVHPTLLLFITFPLADNFATLKGIQSVFIALSLFVFIVLLDIPFIKLLNRKLRFLLGK